ncbi:MAG: hypothetical protein JNL57_01280 [Bacteroidetes bacterium]|nr:hypothetical protein [Bacteroidota bacterium]
MGKHSRFNGCLTAIGFCAVAFTSVSCKKEKSAPGPSGWSQVFSTLFNDHALRVKVMPDGKVYFTTLYGKMYVSHDRGKRFVRQAVWGDPYDISDVAWSKEFNFLVGNTGLMGRESDGGSGDDWWQTWKFDDAYDFNSIACLKDYVWICGTEKGTNNSMLLASDNGGSSFVPVYLNNKLLYKTIFITEYNGWLAGDGLLMKSTNRGLFWKPKYQNPDVGFRDITFYDSLNGIAVGFPSAIYRTSNGGESWTMVPSPVSGTLLSVDYTPNGTVWIAGHRYDGKAYKSVLLYSRDMGQTFQAHSYQTNALYSIDFMDDSTGFACGENVMLRTQTGGF